MMKVTLRLTSLLIGLLFYTGQALAQPANDDPAGAVVLEVADGADNVVKVSGDTRGATQSAGDPGCTTIWHNDDVWYTFTTPDFPEHKRVFIRTWFGTSSDDAPALGITVHGSPSGGSLKCFAGTNTTRTDRTSLSSSCELQPNTTYYLRVYSWGDGASTAGTFQIGVYTENLFNYSVLWSETFESNPFTRGFETFGECVVNPALSGNAVWAYHSDGTMSPAGAYTPVTTITSAATFCTGALAVNSDYNDNLGIQNNFGAGPVPVTTASPATYSFRTPPISMDGWNTTDLTVVFSQSVRHYTNSQYHVAFRTKNETDVDWSDFQSIQFNTGLVVNAAATNNTLEIPLPGVPQADYIQLQFNHIANYYYWMIDDLLLVETKAVDPTCSDTRVQSNFFSIAPWAIVPEGQAFPYPVLADILNAGNCDQTGVVLNHTVTNDAGVRLYDDNFDYGDVASQALIENELFGSLVDINKTETGVFTGKYLLSQDQEDEVPTDNILAYQFGVFGTSFQLETGATRNILPAESNWNANAPRSWAYGNAFYPVSDAYLEYVEWGAYNPVAMAQAGLSVYVSLYEWNDVNGDNSAQASEREYVGTGEYIFTGNEVNNSLANRIFSVLDNADGTTNRILLEGGKAYLAMIEQFASSPTEPILVMLASTTRDYGAVILAFDQAFDAGLVTRRLRTNVLAIPNDGNLSNEIDYGSTFGQQFTPVVRLVVDPIVNTKDPLPVQHQVRVFPNPATDQLNVNLDFISSFSDVTLRLIDVTGRIAHQQVIRQAVSKHVETIQLNSIAAGTYQLQVITPDGQRSVPVAVIK